MNQRKYNRDSFLRHCDFQYAVAHVDTFEFIIGEKVFLKSNPEVPMIVCRKTDEMIEVKWKDPCGKDGTYEFRPECLLQYKYAGLQVWKNKFHVCFN